MLSDTEAQSHMLYWGKVIAIWREQTVTGRGKKEGGGVCKHNDDIIAEKEKKLHMNYITDLEKKKKTKTYHCQSLQPDH